jgi:hypothetical protein
LKNKEEIDMTNNSFLKVLESSGLAERAVEEGTLGIKNAWMGIGTNENTYPDEFVMNYLRWASQNVNHFLLVIADDIQAYNRVPFSKDKWDELSKTRKWRELGQKRKSSLQEKLMQEGIGNVEIKTWHEIYADLEKQFNWEVEYAGQLVDHVCQHTDIGQRLEEIVRKKIPGFMGRLEKEKIPEEFGIFSASGYGFEEITLTCLLATNDLYPIKVGHIGEKDYDEITAEIISKQGYDSKTKFGAIYLG